MRPDAINDILMSPRFQGAIDSIHGVTEFVDQRFAQFISLVAFFIISAALLRNVVAGAYAAYPKFWDMVADAKDSMKGRQIMVNGTDVSFMAKVIAFFIPNLKAMSDFNDSAIEPKHYFIVAIPKMVLVVMIGLTIYNGYYRDVVKITAGFGTTILSRFVLNTDPVAIVDRVVESARRPDFASEGDDSTLGRYTSSITKAAYSQVVSFYTDVKDEGSKSKISTGLESAVYGFLQQNSQYLNEDKYDMKYQVDRILGEPDLTKIGAGNSTDSKYTTLGTKIDIRGLGFDSLQHKDEAWFIRVIVRFEQKVQKIKDTGVYQDLYVTVYETGSQVSKANGAISTITLQNASTITDNGGTMYTFTPGTGKIVFTDPVQTVDGTIIISPKLNYQTPDGKIHSIGKIKIVPYVAPAIQKVTSESRPEVTTELGKDFPK